MGLELQVLKSEFYSKKPSEFLLIKFFSDEQIRSAIKEDEVRIASSKNEFYRKSSGRYWPIKFFSD